MTVIRSRVVADRPQEADELRFGAVVGQAKIVHEISIGIHRPRVESCPLTGRTRTEQPSARAADRPAGRGTRWDILSREDGAGDRHREPFCQSRAERREEATHVRRDPQPGGHRLPRRERARGRERPARPRGPRTEASRSTIRTSPGRAPRSTATRSRNAIWVLLHRLVSLRMGEHAQSRLAARQLREQKRRCPRPPFVRKLDQQIPPCSPQGVAVRRSSSVTRVSNRARLRLH